MPVSDAILTQILTQLQSLQVSQQALQAKLDSLTNPVVSPLSSPKQSGTPIPGHHEASSPSSVPLTISQTGSGVQTPSALFTNGPVSSDKIINEKDREKLLYPSRVLLSSREIRFVA
ncbi:predicted protein [Sparassis crispa]|uniref:Uncharacterized protein n=1 Tax=Sparassis crispa TaxID=139825 RepID=A0A401GLR2_9APHY|nr:predicted protein [Sparassis crispa]GBE83100.1 predicted protein [Sparassis crispa]